MSKPTDTRPPEPTTMEEARQEGMGFVRAVIDMAREMVPSGVGVTPRMALVALCRDG